MLTRPFAMKAAPLDPARVVILDTQNIRGAPLHLLERLVEHRFTLHLSVVSFEELWAQAVRENQPGLLGRLRKVARYLSPLEPLKTAGVSLVQRLGGTVREPLIPISGEESQKLREMWRLIVSEEPPERRVVEGAKLIEAGARERARSWLETMHLAAAVSDWDPSVVSEQVLVRKVAHQFFQTIGPRLSIRHGMHERFQGFYRVAALHAARAKARLTGKLPKVQENDAEDMQLLMHLAEGAFIATFDLGLIELVDASESFQSPWVRTIGELLTQEMPSGVPWGRSARRAADLHVVRDRSELRRLEDAVRRTGSS